MQHNQVFCLYLFIITEYSAALFPILQPTPVLHPKLICLRIGISLGTAILLIPGLSGEKDMPTAQCCHLWSYFAYLQFWIWRAQARDKRSLEITIRNTNL